VGTVKSEKLGEFTLIDWIRKSCFCSRDVKKGIGDDTAVLPFSAKKDMLLTTDMSVEGVHFTRTTLPELIGRKALARNLSDIAAMGGVPTYAVISLGLPKNTKTAYVQKIYHGINKLAKQFSVSIVGGDTVKSPKIILNIALLGKVTKAKAVLRSGAKPGDQIFLTGYVGGSLKSGRHLTFTPRLKEAQDIVKHFHPTAMIDVSDGLTGDLGHILKESGVGAVLDAQCIPLHHGVDLKAGLYDGEDFELIFTVKRVDAPKLLRSKTYMFHHIGRITKNKNKLYLADTNGKTILLTAKGFTHF